MGLEEDMAVGEHNDVVGDLAFGGEGVGWLPDVGWRGVQGSGWVAGAGWGAAWVTLDGCLKH